MSERVGLFGGSFDPVHIGHQHIVQSFLESDLIDTLWILPTLNPPHKNQQELTEYSIRCEMVKAAFQNWPRVKVSLVEEHLQVPNYTLKTVQYLQDEYPQKKFLLCIGSDSLVQIATWYRYKELLDHCDLLVARRPEYDASEVPPEARVRLVEHQPVSFSSTEIRQRISCGESVSGLVPPEVLEVIEKYGLYNKDH
ncbi:MAG: nicotinate (nicotinamide) nucleotide adenylyltransferase [Balneolales bacterium]